MVGAMVACVVTVACTTSDGSAPRSAPSEGSQEASVASACDLPSEQLLRVWRGTIPGVGGNVQLVPAEPHYLGAGFSHTGPWDYVQRVPMFFYGPPHVAAAGIVDVEATLADIAPTTGAIIGFDFDAPDGEVLEQVLRGPEGREHRPRLLLTVVWDAVGRNVLDAWPDAWPNLRRMIPGGAWIDHATVGSSPSNTPPTHATIGTGGFPRNHGILDSYVRIDGREYEDAELGPSALQLPTLADRYAAAANDPRALTGIVATLTSHVGMLGHGSLWPGVPPPLAVVRQEDTVETAGEEGAFWRLTSGIEPYFRFPDYVNDMPGIERDLEALDRADGQIDGRWGPHPFSALKDGFSSPARTTYQTRIVKEVIRREGFGADPVTDLLFVNFKATDTIGHIWTLNSDEVRQSLEVQDAELGELVAFLDEQVGRGEWAMVLTADHGHQFDPAISGAFQMTARQIESFLETRFGGPDHPVVEKVRPTEVWVDEQALAEVGATLDDVAAAIREVVPADLAEAGADLSAWPVDEQLFSAAFPTSVLDDLLCLTERERGSGDATG